MTCFVLQSSQLERLYERYVLQANLNHLTNLLGLLIATSMVMELGLLGIAIRTSNVPDDGATSKSHLDQRLTLGAIVLGIIVYAGLANIQYENYTGCFGGNLS